MILSFLVISHTGLRFKNTNINYLSGITMPLKTEVDPECFPESTSVFPCRFVDYLSRLWTIAWLASLILSTLTFIFLRS